MPEIQDTTTEEIWKPVPGYEGLYEVSSAGRVRSFPKARGGRSGSIRMYAGIVMRPQSNKVDGRLHVRIHKNGRGTSTRIHKLVSAAFLGQVPEGMEVCHNDGNPVNNAVENLRYDTKHGNMKDKIKHGTDDRGEKNHNAKLTAEDVLTIRQASGTRLELSTRFGVSRSQISRIIQRNRWAHIQNIHTKL